MADVATDPIETTAAAVFTKPLQWLLVSTVASSLKKTSVCVMCVFIILCISRLHS